MTDHDDVLKELDAALQVEPSRAFADGVRARVNRSRMNSTRVWWGLAAAASIGLVTMTLWRPASKAPVQVPQLVNAAPVHVPTAVPAPAPVGSVARAEPVGPAAKMTPAVPVAANTASEPPLEVITNQMAVLRQLWADVKGRTLVVAEAEPALDGLAPRTIAVDPIAVQPIVVSEIGREPGAGGANPIIRRANATKETR